MQRILKQVFRGTIAHRASSHQLSGKVLNLDFHTLCSAILAKGQTESSYKLRLVEEC